MSALRQALDDYLALRHAMGFKLHEAHRLLPHFVAFLERHGAVFVTTDWAVRWATQPPHVQPAEWARRLRLVRGFAQYHSTLDPRTEIPPPEVLPYRHPRRSPYLYSEAEIARLLAAARHLPSATGLRAHTYATALGLLAVTGMRISELVALANDDVDLGDGLLTLRHTKFGKSRCLPLHPTTRQALCGYVHLRDRVYPIPNSPSFFVSEQGTRLTHWTVRATFVQLSCQIGLRDPTDSYGPRLHDFRHRFAVQTLVRWYREGVDVERHLPELSTYLGHVKVSDTYWYLSATPELLGLATQRLEQAHRRFPS
jgi:integrase/recombinase XerD